LGLDGSFGAREIVSSVEIETIKSPTTLGCTEKQRKVVYEGNTRGAVQMFPYNANVHAEIALAGIGIDRTHSTVIADADVLTNTQQIVTVGDEVGLKLNISSVTTGGVPGSYTPISASGSLDRVLGDDTRCIFV